MSGPISFTTPAGIAFYRLCVLKQGVSLEGHGIKFVRRSLLAQAKREYGLKRNATREEVLAVLDAEIEKAHEARRVLVETELAAGRPVPPL